MSTSVRDFTVTMLGYYLAERAAEEGKADGDLGVFLRWEQLAAYARGGFNDDWVFRGTERTQKNWNESKDRVHIGTESRSLILSDQKTYGLWGLYSVPARSSGLITGVPSRLTPDTRTFVESNYVAKLGGNGRGGIDELVNLLSKPNSELRPQGRDSVYFNQVATVLHQELSGAEGDFYTAHLVDGGPRDSTSGGQRVLASVMRETLGDADWQLSPVAVRHLAKRCRAIGGEMADRVASRLEKIRIAEQLLAPAAHLFAYLLANDKQPVDDIIRRVGHQWGRTVATIDLQGLADIESELVDASGEPDSAKRLRAVAEALVSGDYAVAIARLLEQNSSMMAMRGSSAPWAELRDGKLFVKFVAEDANELPARDRLSLLWNHSYFLDSLRTITAEIDGSTNE